MICIGTREEILELAKTSITKYLEVTGKKKACLTFVHEKIEEKVKSSENTAKTCMNTYMGPISE